MEFDALSGEDIVLPPQNANLIRIENGKMAAVPPLLSASVPAADFLLWIEEEVERQKSDEM